MNKVFLLGNLGRDPETRSTNSGSTVTNFSIATTERWRGKDGQAQEVTTWHRCVSFGGQAEYIAEHIKKGGRVLIEGSIQTREWEDKEGSKRETTEIRVLSIRDLSPRADKGTTTQEDEKPPF